MKNQIIFNKDFPPLDDLYILLEQMQNSLKVDIEEENYIIGRKQLFYIFMHETMHAFIAKSAKWIYDLTEDETDFIDEVAARIIIDDLIKELDIYRKVDLYYENHVNHRKGLVKYGYNLEPEQYDAIEEYYKKVYSKTKNIDEFCHYVHSEYKRLAIRRKEDFSYKMND
jgi:hypothetical protein